MSIKNWPGGVITPTPVEPTGPYQNSSASGVWTLQQATDLIKQGNWPTAGNVDPSLFIENLFQTWLYTGNGSTQTITNGIDLAGKGGLVWIKARSAAYNHSIFDTDRGRAYGLFTNLTQAQTPASPSNNDLTSFNSDGFSLGTSNYTNTNISAETFASWTFREQAKFFDVVTYTGNGTGQTINHNLGSVPGCIIIKQLSGGASGGVTNWSVYHRSLGNTDFLWLNSTTAKQTSIGYWNNTTPTSTAFTVGSTGNVNESGGSFVAYLFAHDAGGFGQSGSDNVISCGSFTDGSGVNVSLGYEPQFLIYKNATQANNWRIVDNMRGFSETGYSILSANLSNAESSSSNNNPIPTATGFKTNGSLSSAGDTIIYIAIRRGPMKTPTTGTEVFSPVAYTGDNSGTTGQFTSAGFPVDLAMQNFRSNPYGTGITNDRLRGFTGSTGQRLLTYSTSVEANTGDIFGADNNIGVKNYGHPATETLVNWMFRRAPGFFDVVCYTGTGVARTVTHNLGVAPELMIFKERGGAGNWLCYHTGLGATKGVFLNLTNTPSTSTTFFNDTSPTNTVFTVGTSSLSNSNLATYVAYLFATCPGVSKVGSYTGTGNTLQIDCGFTGGARFVLIKRTDSTGDWYVWDSARGIVSGNDPYLLLNSTAAEVTTTDWVDTYSAGFELSNAGGNNANINTASYIFLAIS